MSFDDNEKKRYFHMGLTFFLAACAIIVFLVLVLNYAKVLSALGTLFKVAMPVIDGLILTYVLAPFVNMIENKWIYKRHSERLFKGKEGAEKGKVKSRVRVFSIAFTYVCFLLMVTGLLYMVIPEIASNVQSIAKNYPEYEASFINWANSMLEKYPDLEKNFNALMEDYSEPITAWVNTNIIGRSNELLMGILSGSFNFLRGFVYFIVGLVIALYLLNSKELMVGQCKKVIYAIFRKDTANAFIHNVRYTNKTIMDFFSGKLIDSLIIALLCFIATTIIGTPYALLISVIIGITNIIPFFGPFIGAIPSAVLVLLVDPKQCLYFIIMIIILQQLDGHVIGPLILGKSIGLSAFWIVFAITIFGGLFGFVGMVIGVPVFAVIYTGISSVVKTLLEKKGLDNDTKRYVHVDYINEDNEYVRLPKEQVKDVMSGKKFKDTFLKK